MEKQLIILFVPTQVLKTSLKPTIDWLPNCDELVEDYVKKWYKDFSVQKTPIEGSLLPNE